MNTNNNETVDVQNNTLAGDVQTSWEYALENERSYCPLVDIYETKDDFILTANLPGIKREDVKLKLEEGSLTIFGKADYNAKLQKKYLLNETGIGHYYRKFRISDSIDQSGIEASHENGQLIVKLPKHDKVKPRTININ